MLKRWAFLVTLLLASAVPLYPATVGGTPPVPLPLFPPNNWWNTDVSAAPVDPNSASLIQFIGSGTPLHPDFGGDAGGGFIYGFPFIVVNGAQTRETVTFTETPEESDGVNHMTNTSFPYYPVPDEAITMSGWIEDGPPGNVDDSPNSDRHMLIVDQTNNTLYELYNVFYNGTGWEAGSGAFFDMNTNDRRPDTWTSADAAGLAILPGLIRYDEVAGPDEIRHAFRFTVQPTNGKVYPASHVAGSTAGALPMGARLRLKSATNISGFTPDVQKIFRALKKYGLILADNGSNMYISGTYDTRWDNDVLNAAFGMLDASDFEVVQLGWQPSVSFIVTVPAVTGAGDPASVTVAAYDTSYGVATGYRGTVHFTSTDGTATLPANYTFTAGDNGTHTFGGGVTFLIAGLQTITATDVVDPTINGTRATTVGPATPVGLLATALTITSVRVSWSASAGASQYEILRASASAPYAHLTTTPSSPFDDATVSPGATYVYKVRAIDASSHLSPLSAPDAATTIFFTDDPIMAMGTVVKAVHLTELRTAVNAMRAAASLSGASFTDVSLTGVPVKAVHIQQLRAALDEARTSLGLPAISYTDPAISAGTPIRGTHVQQLRAGVQ